VLNEPLLQPQQASGLCLNSLDLFLILTNEGYEEPIPSGHIIQVRKCEAWWQITLLGFWLTFWTSLMCTFQHDLALKESDELSANLSGLQWSSAHMTQGIWSCWPSQRISQSLYHVLPAMCAQG